MLYIDKTTLIGRGRHRECYKHAEDQNLCIKITVKDSPLEIKREKNIIGIFENMEFPGR